MAKKEADLVMEATLARNALTRFSGTTVKAQKARDALEKAVQEAAVSVQAKREALAEAMK